MTHQNDYSLSPAMNEEITRDGFKAVPERLRVLINSVLPAERAKYLQAEEYERTEERQGHANGYKPKTVRTRMGEIIFAVPQVREGGFYPSALEKGLRSERAWVTPLAEMYVQGVSTRKVKAIPEELCGIEISAMQVSRATVQLDATLQEWRERPLAEMSDGYLDARYEKVREAGQVCDAAVLVATGITPAGERQVPGASVALSEHESHGKAFLQGLKDRGLHGIKWVISDDHTGLGAARRAVFGSIPWQRCQFHPQHIDPMSFGRMLGRICPSRQCGWKWRQISGRCSMLRTRKTRRIYCKLPSSNMLLVRRSCRPGWRRTWRKDLRYSTFRWNTGGRSVLPTAWSGSTEKSVGALGWLVFSPTRRLVYAWFLLSSWRPAKSGRLEKSIALISH